MEEISKEKRRFLHSIGIDINNLPPEFQRHNSEMGSVLTDEEMDFLDYEGMVGTFSKKFRLKDLIGTNNPSYADKSWIEAFLLSKRGDATVEEYFKNPEYYSVGLKQFDQSHLKHITPIELYERDGQFFIKGGNNRLSLIMMKYLAEMSRAQSDEERTEIDEKYTFVAQVNSIPKDKDVMHMINMIRMHYGRNVRIKRTSKNESEYQYTIQIGDKEVQIKSKEELEQFIIDRYKIQESKTVQELSERLGDIVSDGIQLQFDEDKKRILNKLFPNLHQFKDVFLKLRVLNLEDKLYEGIDLNNINYNEIVNKAIELVEREEKRRIQEQEKIKVEQEEKRRAEKEAESKRRTEQNKKNVAIKLKKESIGQQTESIPNDIEITYNEIKQEEVKFSRLAMKLGLTYVITKTDDTDIQANINQIKNNMQKITDQIQNVDDLPKLDKVSAVLQELHILSQDGTITSQYSAEIKETFEKSFDAKVQDLIKQSKISKLQEVRGSIESEKVSILGKILGKGKLKQAKLDNIDLKIKLLMSEQEHEKVCYSLEESLSELYAYSNFELGKKFTPEMQQFLIAIKTEPELKQMIDQQTLKTQYVQKLRDTQNAGQLISADEKRKISNRQQIVMLQLQNNDISRQIQSNRAKTVTKQNNLSSLHIGTNGALNKFQNIVSEIKMSTQIQEHQREEQQTL